MYLNLSEQEVSELARKDNIAGSTMLHGKKIHGRLYVDIQDLLLWLAVGVPKTIDTAFISSELARYEEKHR